MTLAQLGIFLIIVSVAGLLLYLWDEHMRDRVHPVITIFISGVLVGAGLLLWGTI